MTGVYLHLGQHCSYFQLWSQEKLQDGRKHCQPKYQLMIDLFLYCIQHYKQYLSRAGVIGPESKNTKAAHRVT